MAPCATVQRAGVSTRRPRLQHTTDRDLQGSTRAYRLAGSFLAAGHGRICGEFASVADLKRSVGSDPAPLEEIPFRSRESRSVGRNLAPLPEI